jgi:hypothetical protein
VSEFSMIYRLPIDLIVEIGLLAGPDEYEELAKTSERNAIILQKPYIINATNNFVEKKIHRLRGTVYSEYLYMNKLHSFNDQPAKIYECGLKAWYKHGNLHRDNDHPAVIEETGTKYWYQHYEMHRNNDRPAIIYFNGTEMWYQHGIRHRENDLPAITRVDGSKEWYQHGKLHRDNDQPAIIRSDKSKQWYQHGTRIK